MSDLRQYLQDQQTKLADMNTNRYVAMANTLIRGQSKLSLNELRLLRFVVMQVRPEDEELQTVIIPIKDLADKLGIDRSNLYRDMKTMSSHLSKESVHIETSEHKWIDIPWLAFSECDEGIIKIRLNDLLKPYVIGLQKWYSQYQIEDIIKLKSAYSIRIYEMITMCLMNKKAFSGTQFEIYISLEELRRATDTTNKLKQIGQFKDRVLKPSIEDINERSPIYVTVRDDKVGRSIVGFYFTIASRNDALFIAEDRGDEATAERLRTKLREHEAKQITIADFFGKGSGDFP